MNKHPSQASTPRRTQVESSPSGGMAQGEGSGGPLTLRALGNLLIAAGKAWVDDEGQRLGAALAYYTLFSIAPMLLIVVSVVGLVFGPEAARGELFAQIAGLIGEQSAQTLQNMLQSINRPGAGIVSAIIGISVMLVGATRVFAELQYAMDRIWRAQPAARPAALDWLRVRLLSLGLVLGIGFVLMVSLIASAAIAGISRWASPWVGATFITIASTLDIVLSFALLMVLFAMLYKWLPQVRTAWRDVWIGAAVTTLLFSIGKWLIGQYIGRTGVASAFGAAGSVVVLMVWVYYSAQIMLFGAEISSVYAHRHGSLAGRTAPPAR